MRKVGKYQKMRKNALMNAYITSILCLVLCVTMFFGTTAAWFTDTAESTGNQMYVGTLAIKLEHASFANKVLGQYAEVKANADADNPIIDSNIKWEPGYTAVEKFRLTEMGDLAFSYQMGIECAFADTLEEGTTAVKVSAEDKKKIAQAITVWNYVGPDAKEIGEVEAKPLAEDFTTMATEGWTKVGTLLEVIEGNMTVFSGAMNKTAVNATKTEGEGENQKTVDAPAEAYHIIALHMKEDFADSSVQGKTLDDITIKLVATQKASEQDAFGSDYDGDYVFVSNEDEFYKAIENGATKIMLAEGDYELDFYTDVYPSESLTITGQGAGTKIAFLKDQVRLQLFENLTISNCQIGKMVNKTWGHLVFSTSENENGVYTVSNCIFDCDNTQGVYINETVSGATYNIVNCTFNGTFGNDAAITIQDNNAAYFVNVAGCEFSGDSRAIVAVTSDSTTNVEYGTWTLSVDGKTVPFADVKK